MGKALKVKDFIIDISTTLKEVEAKKVLAQKSHVHRYEIILENNTDFVLNRKTATTDRSLVFLISQGLFYIKNNKNDNIDEITEARLRAFYQQIYYDKFESFEKVAWWGNKSPENKIEIMMAIVENESMQKMYKHCVFASIYDCKKWKDAFDTNTKLFTYCHDKVIGSAINAGGFSSILDMSKEIHNKIDYNNAVIFIDLLTKGNVKWNLYDNGYGSSTTAMFMSLIDTYNMNFTRYIKYLFEDLYTQGISTFDDNTLIIYKDYLRMQTSLYGKVKDKYPKYLKVAHDLVVLKLNIYKKHEKDLQIFNVADEYKDLGITTKIYSIVLPKTSMDIVDEGVAQNHCVASYVEEVARNETLILFLRDTDDIDKSLVTIEVKDSTVKQVRGFGNRLPSEDESEFLIKWAKKKELAYEPSQTILN